MKRSIYYVLVAVLLTNGCKQHNETQNSVELRKVTSAAVAVPGSLIDYKKDKYHLYIGQDKDSVDKIIDLRHNYLADDGMINDSGITHYMNIGENLIRLHNKEEVLPALFFTTNKKKVIAFSCSIVCGLYDDDDKASIVSYLKSFTPYFSALKEEANRNKLANNLSLVIRNPSFEEKFRIDTVGKKYHCVFSYDKHSK